MGAGNTAGGQKRVNVFSQLLARGFGQVQVIDRQGEGNASVTDRFGITGQPVIVLLDAEGSEVQRFFGFVQEADLRAALDGLLG